MVSETSDDRVKADTVRPDTDNRGSRCFPHLDWKNGEDELFEISAK